MENNLQTNILVVDDDKANLLTLEAVLTELNQNLVFAESGMEALKYAIKFDFSLMLIDVQMPDMDGFETAAFIRQRKKSRYTPIIFLTAHNKNYEDINKGYELGAVDYIFKPINQVILKSKVKFFVDFFTKSSLSRNLQLELEKRKKIEDELKSVNDKLEMMINSIGEGIIGLNQEGIITFINPTGIHLLGSTAKILVGMPIKAILQKSNRNADRDLLERIFAKLETEKIVHVYDTEFCMSNGIKIPIDYTITVGNKQHRDIAYLMVFKDITIRKHAEKLAVRQKHQIEIEHLAKQSSIEEVVTEFAHELNQPLASIANYAKGLCLRLEKDNIDKEELLKILNLTNKHASYAGDVIHRIKNFIRRSKINYEKINIEEVIVFIIELLDNELKEYQIKVDIFIAKKFPDIFVGKTQIEQVLLNILRNSIEAIKEMSNKEKFIKIEVKLVNTKAIIINIIDNGPGFDEDTQKRVFDAYFTTKSNGIGMGLAICRSIIASHNGQISAENLPQGGARFQITLPIINREDIM